ncbi:hypothetical protein Tco_0870457 [Tanacetum coccineum]
MLQIFSQKHLIGLYIKDGWNGMQKLLRMELKFKMQFWATAMVKTVNGEVQIQALVDKKKVIITETSVRSDLQLEDAEGTECLPNAIIFKQLTLMSANTTAWNEFSSTMAFAVICLATNQKFNFSKYIFNNMVKNLEGGPLLLQPSTSKTPEETVYNSVTEEDTEDPQSYDPRTCIKTGEEKGKKLMKLTRLHGDMAEKEVDMAEKDVSIADPITTGGEVVTTANVVVSTTEVTTDSTTTTTVDELTLWGSDFNRDPKPVKTKPEKPLKKKDQIMFDKEVAQKLQAQLDAKLEEEEKLARQREEDSNIVEWDNVHAMMDADYELGARLQAEEQGELTIEEKSRLFVVLHWNKRKKHFARLRAEDQRRKPPTKAQKRNTMSTYLKNMAGYKHNQLKTKSFKDIQMLFDKEMKRVNTFVDIDTELVKGSETRTEGSSKRAGEELESKNLKKQKLDENVEAEVDDDQEEAEMKKHMEIVPDDEVEIDAIPLATKPLIIVDWKIIKEGKMRYFQIIRADGSSKRYPSMIQILQNIDREDLKTLWKLVKAKHGLTRPEEGYERVLWSDLKVIFKLDVESKVWRNLQGHKVIAWKLFSSNGVHFVRFKNLHIFMLVEKRYPLTPATITEMLNKKLQADHWNEMCYELLKLMTKQLKNPGNV